LSDRGLVFIIDHDAASTDVLGELLEQDGYAVASVSCGTDALRAVTSAAPNLVLLDAHLCDANPFELLAQLRASSQARDIPVIVMTNRDDDDTRVKGLESGDDLIVKPFDKREVLARIERQVTVSKGAHGPARIGGQVPISHGVGDRRHRLR
jgi:DNA-binding response OmpR family regulator